MDWFVFEVLPWVILGIGVLLVVEIAMAVWGRGTTKDTKYTKN